MEEKLKLLQNMKKPESFKKIVIALIIFLITYVLVAVSFSNQPYYS